MYLLTSSELVSLARRAATLMATTTQSGGHELYSTSHSDLSEANGCCEEICDVQSIRPSIKQRIHRTNNTHYQDHFNPP